MEQITPLYYTQRTDNFLRQGRFTIRPIRNGHIVYRPDQAELDNNCVIGAKPAEHIYLVLYNNVFQFETNLNEIKDVSIM